MSEIYIQLEWEDPEAAAVYAKTHPEEIIQWAEDCRQYLKDARRRRSRVRRILGRLHRG